FEQPVTHGVSCFVADVDRTKFSDPYGRSRFPHVFRALEKGSLHDIAVDMQAARNSRARTTVDKPRQRVVISRVHHTRPWVSEHMEGEGVPVAFEKKDVIGIDGTDRIV